MRHYISRGEIEDSVIESLAQIRPELLAHIYNGLHDNVIPIRFDADTNMYLLESSDETQAL